MSYVNFNRALTRAQIEALGSNAQATNGKIYFATDGGIYVGLSTGAVRKEADSVWSQTITSINHDDGYLVIRPNGACVLMISDNATSNECGILTIGSAGIINGATLFSNTYNNNIDPKYQVESGLDSHDELMIVIPLKGKNPMLISLLSGSAPTRVSWERSADVIYEERDKKYWNIPVSFSKPLGMMYRNNVNGSGSISVYNTSGKFPTIPAGTYRVKTYMSSSTQSYTLTSNFGSQIVTLSTTNGVIDDIQTMTFNSQVTWTGSMTTVANNTVLQILICSDGENVDAISTVGTTGYYYDLVGRPSIPTVTNSITQGSTDAVSSGAVYTAIGDIETLLAAI